MDSSSFTDLPEILEGPLSKWTNVVQGWQCRWFVLDKSDGLLKYFTSRQKMSLNRHRGCIRLQNSKLGLDDEDKNNFTIRDLSSDKIFHFKAKDIEERRLWMKHLEDSIRLKYDQEDQVSTLSSSFDKSLSSLKSIDDFSSKLKVKKHKKSELSKFSRIEQFKKNQNKLECMIDEVKKFDHESITLTSTNFSEGLLDCLESSRQKIMKTNLDNNNNLGSIDGYSSEEEGSEVFTKVNTLKTPTAEAMLSRGEDLISDGTSSSSDEFYDADSSPLTEVKNIIDQNEKSPLPTRRQSVMNLQNQSDFWMEEHSDAEGDSPDFSQNTSVIRYLLSQVRIGMDLTKIPLPTFILEPRSLLEMYASFFSHPDIFVSISVKTTPKERFVAALKWYMSSFHAGKKGSIAKKPYNPILGEKFQCLFDPNDNSVKQQTTSNFFKPLPDTVKPTVSYAKSHNIQFVGEQVSHHPPISAFYTEHLDNKIQFNGQIWTKSKYLGLSVGVHNIGQGVITLLDGPGKGEEYIINFPSAYGRSILGVPWMELGGECSLTCSQTGFSASVEFHTKPFYKGKVHRVTANAFEPNDKKKPFLKIEGEWNGEMKESSGKAFVNTYEIPIHRKYVPKLKHQSPNESRQLWNTVTKAMLENDIEVASDGKRFLEQKQRDERNQRAEKNETWIPVLFEKRDDLWLYKSRLSERLKQSDF